MPSGVVYSYGPSYPNALESLSSPRPASTESKATTTSACFFEVPNANQNDDLMVRLLIVVPDGAAGGECTDLMSWCLANCMLHLRRDEMRANPLYGTNCFLAEAKRACLIWAPPLVSSSTSLLHHPVVLELLCLNAPQLPFLTNGALKLSWSF